MAVSLKNNLKTDLAYKKQILGTHCYIDSITSHYLEKMSLHEWIAGIQPTHTTLCI